MSTRLTVIDDSAALVETIARQCEESVFDVQLIMQEPFFDDEIEAEIANFRPDLVILDLVLSDDMRSGFRVLRKIKESVLLTKIPVVICSKCITNDKQGNALRTKAIERGAIDAISQSAVSPDALLCLARRLGSDRE
jgi:DNA-binding response OmpR family regulator